ncbi:MAG: VOC family protein, partial [Alphaproteobacteria bacterium]|nr:VOC family protein [Alphaproteobacteria bacterium]
TATRPRWFSLDTPQTEIKLRAGPRPLCWVWGVPDINYAVAACGYDPGRIITMTRDDLQWRLTVADDGGLAENGILPILIPGASHG